MTTPDETGNEVSTGTPERTRITGASAWRLHLTLTAGLALCVAAFTIEIVRALGGNELSWLYVFEWPLFAAFGIYVWWSLLTGRDRVRRPARSTRAASGVDEEKLAAWSRYVGELEESGPDPPESRPDSAA